MGDFKKRGGFGGGRDDKRGGGGFGGGRSKFNRPGSRDSRQTEMFSTTCAECHKPCEVPFRPNGEKPVYCSNCFRNKSGGSNEYPRRDSSSRDFSKRDFNSAPVAKPQFDLGQINEIKKQLDTLNSKIDRLVEMMTKNPTPLQMKSEKKIDAIEIAKVVKKAVEAPKKEVKKIVAIMPKKVFPKKVAGKTGAKKK